MISDAGARYAALNTDKSFIVQAPAGSGKTGLLVYRMLNLLTTVEQPQQVLAITFTRKATAEMRARLLELLQLAETEQESEDPFLQQGIELAQYVLRRDRALGWNLLDSPHQLQVLTIDSFCAKLTASMPWLSRLGDRPRTTDYAEPLYAAAIEQLMTELLDPESAIVQPLRTVLLELDFNYNKARQLFSTMLANRDQWLRHLLQNNLSAVRDSLERSWQEIVDQQISGLKGLLSESVLRELVTLGQGAAQQLYAKDPKLLSPLSVFNATDAETTELSLSHWRALVHLLVSPSSQAFRKRVDIRLGFVAKSQEKKQLEAYLAEIADDQALRDALLEVAALPQPQYSEYDWQQLIALEQVLKALAGLLQLRFRAVGECDHSEVTQRANLALQELDNPTDLGLRMDYHLQHILVDEFQDTSTAQIELLKKLTAGWTRGDAKTLFLVGDPMQSIYRFREADVSLFLQVADNHRTGVFENLTIEPLTLSQNFRSSPTLVDWFNQTFEHSFPDTNNVLTGAIKYSHAESGGAAEDNPVTLELARDRADEASLLVMHVQQAIERLPDASARIAILVRSRSQLAYLLPALRRAGVSYTGVDIQALHEQQAVIDVLALCKAICRVDDRVSWLALLRGPWCGLTLGEIKLLVGRTDQTVWQQLSCAELDNIDRDAGARLQRFVVVMSLTMRQRQQVELSSLVRWAWRAFGGEQTLLGVNPDDIETVFELLEGVQRGGDIASLNDLDKAMDGLFARPSQADVEQARVVVSTMHKSKGLQYHTVILPGLANQPRAEDKAIMMWAEHQNQRGGSSLLLAPLRLNLAAVDHYSYLRRLDNQRAANEAIRLMYVAATRAERKLILLAQVKTDSETDEIKAPIRSSLLATIWNSVEAQGRLTSAYNQDDEPESEPSQRLLRLPSGFAPEHGDAIDWQVKPQLNTQMDEQAELLAEVGVPMEFEWATEVATGVGIVLHDWLQYNAASVLTATIGPTLTQRWRAELASLRVPDNRIDYAIKRLTRAVRNIQADTAAHFLFDDYPIAHNEFALSAFEDGRVSRYRLDRTFVDADNVRWIVDYKSTDTNNDNVAEFVDEQIATRHRPQLQKYGALMSHVDSRPIMLCIYFPLLQQLRSWKFES